MHFNTGIAAKVLCAVLAAPGVELAAAKTSDEYSRESFSAAQSLQSHWYNEGTGLWDNAWWNSGNAFTTLADLGKLRPGSAIGLNLKHVIQNTFERAQQARVSTVKTFTHQGMMSTQSCVNGQGDCGNWALGLIHAYDYAGNQAYLDAAVRVFQDMQTGLGGPCNGGIYWNKDRQYVNAIANELYLSVAASLANRIPADKDHYTTIARDQWNWFRNSGMINNDHLINDGLTSDCRNNGGLTWSYNQGVVLGGLAELLRATNDRQYLDRANEIASAAISWLSDSNGVLVEVNRCEFDSSRCGRDGQQFKGVFVRNLRYLHEVAPNDNYKNFILRNADSIWENDRGSDDTLGVAWPGPYFGASGMTQSSAMDALVAALAVA